MPDESPTLAALAARDGVRFLLATFVDLDGKLCAKLVPVEAADEFEAEGVGFAGYAVGAMGQQPHDPDMMVLPDLASYTPLPWVREGLAMVQCDPHVEGAPWPYAPRVILKAALAKAKAQQLELFVGSELEYFLLTRDEQGRITPVDRLDRAVRPCYDARGLTRMYEHLTEVSTAMNTLGWGNYANDHEDANGQFEQNFVFADALTTADRVVTARYLISMLAEKRGMQATFMPKPFTDRTGNGMHLHVSLWHDGTALFPNPEGTDDDRGLGLSPLAYSFVAGVLEHAPALQAVLAPSVNSYKRSGAPTTRSGATWAPKVATYGGNDRTHFIRVPDGNRTEIRAADGAANPYLAMAAVLTAGLAGVSAGADPGPVGDSTGKAVLNPTLLHASEALAASDVVRGALDAALPAGERTVSDYFVAHKREEFLEAHAQVSEWELERYLGAF